MTAVAALLCGFIFGCGLLISGMLQPAKVLAFLDILGAADGRWDPSLAVVMAAALAVSGLGFVLAEAARAAAARGADVLAEQDRHRPAAGDRLGVFGAGWGLVGLCPGPALANLATLSPRVLMFVVAMTAGMVLHDVWQKRRQMIGREAMPAPADG